MVEDAVCALILGSTTARLWVTSSELLGDLSNSGVREYIHQNRMIVVSGVQEDAAKYEGICPGLRAAGEPMNE